jgi:hypothetical protein
MVSFSRAAVTVRQRIIGELYDRLANCRDPTTGNLVFNKVVKEDLDETSAQELPIVGFEESEETQAEYLYPFVRKQLSISVEYRFANKKGVDVYDEFNYYLGVLQKTLLTVQNGTGAWAYAEDVSEVGNTPRIVSRNDNRPGGCLVLLIKYRHYNGDPYRGITPN